MSEIAGNDDVRIEVLPHRPDEEEVVRGLAGELLGHPSVRAHLAGDELRVLRELLDKEPSRIFEAVVHDVASSRSVQVRGDVDELVSIAVNPISRRPIPTQQEFVCAVEALPADRAMAERIEHEHLRAYQPMPPFLD